MKMSLLARKLRLEGREFATAGELRGSCRTMGLDYDRSVRYLLSRGHLLRIFRGIFYVRSFDEMKLGKLKYSVQELVAKGLELKGIRNWYFGLQTALKFNNLTHEHFTVEYVISDTLFRKNPVGIAGYKFRFLKLKPALLTFGIVGDNLKYSDMEKTILDFAYVWRYNGVAAEKILADLAEYSNDASRNKLRKYSKYYPRTVQEIAEGLE